MIMIWLLRNPHYLLGWANGCLVDTVVTPGNQAINGENTHRPVVSRETSF